MSGGVSRSLKGIVTAALSLLIVAGPATAALADGGPDRVLPQGQQASSQRPGFGDRIQPARPGFGDLIQYPAQAPQPAPAVTHPQPSGSGTSVPLVAMAAALTALLAAAGAWYEVSRRKRMKMA